MDSDDPREDRFRHRPGRWLRNSPQRWYDLGFSPFFWRVRRVGSLAWFWLARVLFSTRAGLATWRERTSILFQLSRAVFGQSLVSIALIAGLETIERVVITNGWYPDAFRSQVSPLTSDQYEKYSALLATLAGVSGAILGLYFAAVSVVVSTVYAASPTKLRLLVLREPVGAFYIHKVALLLALTTLVLALQSLGFSPGRLVFLLAVLLSLVSVFGFVHLGMRAFKFLDLTQILPTQEVHRWIRSLTSWRIEWRNPSFQSFCQRSVESALEAFGEAIAVADSQESTRGLTHTAAARDVLRLLAAYADRKHRIPSDSFWFRRVPEHEDWFTASESTVDMAVRTGTSIQPKLVADRNWFEDEAIAVVRACLRTLSNREDLDGTLEVLSLSHHVLGRISERFCVTEALTLSGALEDLLHRDDLLPGGRPATDGSAHEAGRVAKELGVVDFCCLGLIEIVLGFSRSVDSIDAAFFDRLDSRITWKRARTIYSERLPRTAIERLEYLRKCLLFELEVERRIVSPAWYRKQLLAMVFVKACLDFSDQLLGRIVEVFELTEDTVKTKSALFVAQLSSRGLEACEKLAVHLEMVFRRLENLKTLWSVKDLEWPEVDLENRISRIASLREALLVRLAKYSIPLASLRNTSHLPDYFGQSFAVLNQECFRSILESKEAMFRKLFPSYFFCALSAHERLRQTPRIRESQPQTQVVFSSEPLEDLLTISGYALILSELSPSGIWSTVKEVWESYLKGSATAEESKEEVPKFPEFISALMDYRDSVFGLMPRGVLRTAWKQELEHRLREMGLLSEYLPFGRSERKQHPSSIIRTLCGAGSVFHEPRDVFLSVFLLQQPEAKDVSMPSRTQRFHEELERRRRRAQEEKNGEGS